MKNFNILQIITANIMAIFNKLNLFGQMYNYKNIVKLIICAFAISGLAACSSSSCNPTDTVNALTDRVNQGSLSSYTLQDIGDGDTDFLNEVSDTIAGDNTINEIEITISNSDNETRTVTPSVSANDDSWKTTVIDIFSLVGNEDDNKNLTISITYFDGNSNEVSTKTITTLNIIYDGTAPSIESFTDINTLPINNEGFTFTITFSENINTSTFTADDFTVAPEELASITDIALSGEIATITATTNIPDDQEGNLTIL